MSKNPLKANKIFKVNPRRRKKDKKNKLNLRKK